MMKMKYVYNKLVRDKIPQEINKMEGRKANYNFADALHQLKKNIFIVEF